MSFVGEYEAQTRREAWALFDALTEWHGYLIIEHDLRPVEQMVLEMRAQSEVEAYRQLRENH